VIVPNLDLLLRPVAWALIHSLWQGALVALCLWLSLRILRRDDARSRYTVSCAALVVMALLPVVTAITTAPAPTARPVTSMSTAGAAHGPLDAALPWIVAVWITGVVVIGSRHLSSWRRMRRWMLLEATPVEGPILARLSALAARLGIDRPVRLMSSRRLDVPVTIGFLRPAVVVPVSLLTGVPASQFDALLAHELAHVRRHDYLINLLQISVETAFFYHPAVWWISRQIRIERESCCDDVAVALCESRRAYVEALTTLETMRGVAMAMSANGGSLLDRVRRLLGERSGANRTSSSVPAILAVVLLAASLIVGVYACDSPTDSPNATDQDAHAVNESGVAGGEHAEDGHAEWVYEGEDGGTFRMHLDSGEVFELKRPEGLTDEEFMKHVHENLWTIHEQHGSGSAEPGSEAPHAMFIDEDGHGHFVQMLVDRGLIEAGEPLKIEMQDGGIYLNGELIPEDEVKNLKVMLHGLHEGDDVQVELKDGNTWTVKP
jgi:beta-lactamase regulating signal transducer with metallopeptidase domain